MYIILTLFDKDTLLNKVTTSTPALLRIRSTSSPLPSIAPLHLSNLIHNPQKMSTGVGMSECCLSGKVQKGTPKGSEKQIGMYDIELGRYVDYN
jgi:hypothetical protein